MKRRSVLLIVLGTLAAGCVASRSYAAGHPNIVFILADDMGYGDPGCYNPDSKTPTPNIDRLAAAGIRFTDAHAPASVCVPSRYGLLTGRYPFRGQLDWRRRGVIDKGRMTIASFLRTRGYATAMVGKWHLGFDGGPDYDYAKPLGGGPVDRGFDTFFGLPHSLDIVPYYYIRGRRAIAAPTQHVQASASEGWSRIQGAFWRAGPMAPGFKHAEVLPRLAEEAVKVIAARADENRGGAPKPLLLYFPLTAPHTPWLPTKAFLGEGAAGMYGEFVAQVDDTVGRVMAALDQAGMADDTLVIFTSDNGPVWYDTDVKRFGHDSVGRLRGMKGDAYEGGHRVPFVARWPGRIEAGSVSDQTICFTDMLATFAAIVGTDLPAGAGGDSVNILPALLGEQLAKPLRTAMVLKQNATVIRQGDWKLITHLGSGGFSQPRKIKAAKGGAMGQLYNLKEDLGETKNLWLERPEIVKRLTEAAEELKRKGGGPK